MSLSAFIKPDENGNWGKITVVNSSGTEIGINNVGTLGDGVALSNQGISAAAIQYGWNGSTYDRIRVPNVWKYASNGALTGTTGMTVWTPASGKKFRVMGATFQSSIAQAYFLRDAGVTFQIFYPPANEAVTVYFGNGYLSNAANTNLELYNSGSTSATVRISLFGTEE